MKYITHKVWILSLVSLFTDTASEMLYPIMPLYLKSIGFSVVLIGLLEGIAEATAGMSKGYFGKLSDITQKRVPFVQIGYSLSAISKPIIGLLQYPIWIFLARTMDRLGKGIRTSARDAILSTEATKESKGKIFGFHRSMDTFGAVLGPTLALIYLYYFPNDYQTLFIIAFIPGILAVLFSFLLKEKSNITNKKGNISYLNFFEFLQYWKASTKGYKIILLGLLFFTLFNSSDVFLLLKAKHSGIDDSTIIGIYIFYNLIYAIFSYPLGIVADRIGLKKIFIFGLVLFTIVYFLMSFADSIILLIIIFFLYGIYAAATEGISKALLTNHCIETDTATAIGTFSAFQSIFTMLASSIAGLIWYQFGATVTFISTGIVTTLVIIYYLINFKKI